MENHREYMVYVKCFTYNHALFIKDAMNGFAMQRTDFPYVCAIVDDASTDGEPEIIGKYLEEHFDLEDRSIVRYNENDDYAMIFARHKTNHNCFFAVYYLKYNHYSTRKEKKTYLSEWADSKYTAICEGDDYWVDPLKLQKQVNMMEGDIEIGMVHSDCAVLNGDTLKMEHYINRIKSKNIYVDTANWEETIISYYRNEYIIRTCTSLIRTELDGDIRITDPYLFDGHLLLGDTPIWIGILLKHKKIGYIDEETSVYRVVKGSASHAISYQKQLFFAISRYDIRLYYKRKYNILREFFDIEKKYYLYVRLYRFLYNPHFRDIDGNTMEQNPIIRLVAKSGLMRFFFLELINTKHYITRHVRRWK